MAYTNSSLVEYTNLSPNHSGQRTHAIDRISPHCTAGQSSAEGLGEWFSRPSTQASCNYAIDKDGRIGLYVEEKNRSWCTSSNANDQRAVTIECASDPGEPYWMSEKVYSTLIKLCVDICKRNGKKKLLWFADKDKSLNYAPKADEMVITVHRWFANKSCPGDWLYSRLGDLAAKVTAELAGETVVILPTGLTKGDTGEDVKTMQSMMIACGYSCGDAGADGDFGPKTLVALKAFQKDAGLTVDGVYGSKTKAALEKRYKETQTASTSKGLKATSLTTMSESDIIKIVGPLFMADQRKSGILASVSLAQFILESAYGRSELAQNANNCFGMKMNLSSNNWSGSAWDGMSVYQKKTQEQKADGTYITITADFRKYDCIEDSIADHSAYLNGAKNGRKLRYKGLKGCKDYRKAAQIIKDGGYATSLTYVDKLCAIIEKWDLTQYDVEETTGESKKDLTESKIVKKEETNSFSVPFLVRVDIPDLNIRKGPGMQFERTGDFTGRGVFTIVEVKSGNGSDSGWGKLKSGAGWCCLDFCERI